VKRNTPVSHDAANSSEHAHCRPTSTSAIGSLPLRRELSRALDHPRPAMWIPLLTSTAAKGSNRSEEYLERGIEVHRSRGIRSAIQLS
jgi:hypothetical protein